MLTLTRKFNGKYATIGSIHIITKDYKVAFYTLENRKLRIPEGNYKIRCTHSPKFDKHMWRIMDVPRRAGILFHAGNSASDTTGCVLLALGYNEENQIVLWSRDAMKIFNNVLDRNKVYNLKIKNHV